MMDKETHVDGIFSSSSSSLEKNFVELTDPLWTVDDLAVYLKLQPETIRCMARRGELPAIKFGKVWRFQKTLIQEMLVSKG